MFAAAPAVMISVALPVEPRSVPVTVCEPTVVTVQAAPVQLPPVTVKTVEPVASPRLFPYWSRPSAV